MNDQDEYVIVWEAPKLEKPEFRLYYDEKGNALFYTCEKLEGQYVVIDALTYAEGRPDVKVVDGKVIKVSKGAVISKLRPSERGTLCEVEDISIVTDTTGQYWLLKTSEIT